MSLSEDATCDPALDSWVNASSEAGDFPIQNLPFSVFRNYNSDDQAASVCVAIGDQLLDLRGLADDGLLAGIASETADGCRSTTLNQLASLGRSRLRELRQRISTLLQATALPETQAAVSKHLLAQQSVEMQLPFAVGDYTDFYSSLEHATRVGQLFRPDKPLLPNYRHLPIAYHGRASSVVVSGTPVQRPRGQLLQGDAPVYAPTDRLDYEAELGLFIGAGNSLGEPIPIADAADHIFGFCLLNDWSARDIQSWEYQPLGPFLGKNFATTLSPWVVPMDALAPFRVPARRRGNDEPTPLPYLRDELDQQHGNLRIEIEVRLQTAAMREHNIPHTLLSSSNAADLYWTPAQWITHHTGNGCNLRSGDLLGSGTISGTPDESRGCLLELTQGGRQPLRLPNGEARAYLQDGDEVLLTAHCHRDGYRSIGFGSCRGIVQRAH